MAEIRVLIVDDHSLFREGLRSLLERQAGIAVVGEAGDAISGVQLALDLKPDVILMDLHLPGGSGVDATREIVRRLPETRVIALSMYHDAELVDGVILAGGRGYLLKDSRASALVEGIRAVAAGGVAIEPQVGAHVFEEYRRLATEAGRGRPSDLMLAPREIDVLELLAAGHSNRQIAEQLYLSEQTVKNLLTSVYQKLGVANRTEAVLLAIKRGVVKPKGRGTVL